MRNMLRLVFLAAGVALFAYLVRDLGLGALVTMLGRIGWNSLAIAAIYAAYQALRAVALAAAVTGPHRIGWRDALAIRLAGEAVQFLTFTGPFLSEPAKAWLLKGRGLGAVEGFAATLTEYLVYTFVAACMSIAAIGWLLAHGTLRGGVRAVALILLSTMVAFVVTAAWAIVRRYHLLGAILQGVAGMPIPRRQLRLDMAGVHRMEDVLLGILHDRPGRFTWIAILESGSHALHLFELYWIVRALDLTSGLGTAFLIEGATKFVGLAFFFVPGQVGASEGAYTVVFELMGLPAVAGFTVPFVRRLRSVVVSGAGLLAMSLLTRARVAQ